MPDINLRFHKDMLVLSAPVLPALARAGADVERDAELMLLLEPDTFEDLYRLEGMAGAQCFVAPTASFTPARLAQVRMEDRADELVQAAFSAVRTVEPQHILAEVGPCGLPLDATSKTSLNENRDQYMRAGRLLKQVAFDAFFLNGFASCVDLKCALMGLRAVSDRPLFASVEVRDDGLLANGRDTLEEAMAVMAEFEASVAGFSTAAGRERAAELTARAARTTALPLLVQLEVGARDERGLGAAGAYVAADEAALAAEELRAAGAQFLRAAGSATPAYTGALAAATLGLDAASAEVRAAAVADAAVDGAAGARDVAAAAGGGAVTADELAAFVARAQAQVAAALDGNLAIVEADGPQLD